MSTSVETSVTTNGRGFLAVARDYVELTKPSINRMCILMAGGGMFLAPRAADGAFPLPLSSALSALLGTAMAVASANALNMWLERSTDRLMRRTRNRPLAAGRISEVGALVFGVAVGLLGVAVLALTTNLATTLLGLGAIASYVGVYTPMKYKAPLALVVGAIPGAVPPLMGWTAVTGSLDAPGLILFGILFVWQMPHFIAISVVRERDYEAAGIKTVPGVRGLFASKVQALLWALAILPVSLALPLTGVAGWTYAVTAGLAGAWFVYMTARGPWPIRTPHNLASADSAAAPCPHGAAPPPEPMSRWAHKLFVASLVYLPVLIAGLALDVLL